MTDEVTVLLDYTRAEYVRGVRLYLRKTSMAGPRGLALFLLMAAAEAFLLWLVGTTLPNTAVLVLLVMALGVGLFLYVLQPGWIFDGNHRLQDRHRITFSKEDIGMQNSEAGSVLAWTFQTFLTTKEFYFLIQDRANYTILPRRIFSGPAEMGRFEEIVMAALPGIRRKDYR